MPLDVVVVGAGLAGLTCARALQARGAECVVVEAADAVGGRVRTDEVEGFRLDRGFQVLLTAYPTARRWLDFEALELGEFSAGALVATAQGTTRVMDPFREPGAIFETLGAPVGTLADKLRVARLRLAATRGDDASVWERYAGRSAREELATRGFSEAMVESFLRPWLGGIFLERELETPAAMMLFVYRMFARGRAALPAGGMGCIPEQLAAGLRPGTLRLGERVTGVGKGEVRLASGELVEAREVVVATEADAAAELLPRRVEKPAWRSVTCIHWEAPESPLRGEPVLWLNGTGRGRVNNLVVPSDVAGGYALNNKSLVSATILGDAGETDAALVAAAGAELKEHFGEAVTWWRPLEVRRVRQALPCLARPGPGSASSPVAPGLWVCGDHVASASIEGAMASGAAVADLL